MVETVGVREIRQRASELIRRAEAGEEIVVAVSGRPAARLVPIADQTRTWRDVHDLAHIWDVPSDPSWDAERRAYAEVDQSIVDPWEREQE